MAECQNSWKDIVDRKTSELNVKLRNQSDEDKLMGEENLERETSELGELCGVPVDNKQLTGGVTQLMIEIRNLKAEIKEIKVVKDKELKIHQE